MKHKKGITENKLNHMLGVARKCYKLALERGYSEDEARKLFLIGYLHDIGYEFTDNSEEHAEISYNIIKNTFGKSVIAIKEHGNPDIGLNNDYLNILNIADLTVNSFGKECSVYNRLSDIEIKYGKDSNQYTNAVKLAKKLELIDANFGENVENVEVNSHGVNVKIKANILSDDKMREIGFTDYAKDRWYFCRNIEFPNNKQYRNFEVSFSITIPKDGSDIRIDVLDEAFCQPYDYQSMLRRNPEFKTALLVKEQVEEWMKFLEEHGVLTGHIPGEYI